MIFILVQPIAQFLNISEPLYKEIIFFKTEEKNMLMPCCNIRNIEIEFCVVAPHRCYRTDFFQNENKVENVPFGSYKENFRQ